MRVTRTSSSPTQTVGIARRVGAPVERSEPRGSPGEPYGGDAEDGRHDDESPVLTVADAGRDQSGPQGDAEQSGPQGDAEQSGPGEPGPSWCPAESPQRLPPGPAGVASAPELQVTAVWCVWRPMGSTPMTMYPTRSRGPPVLGLIGRQPPPSSQRMRRVAVSQFFLEVTRAGQIPSCCGRLRRRVSRCGYQTDSPVVPAPGRGGGR
jgi:hypothetical protein